MPDPAPVKRACDACHRRKVKCIGEGLLVCRNCRQAGLKCTYNAIPQKKGPKGCRAKVISELRENQRRTTSLSKSTQEPSIGSHSPPPSLSPSSSRYSESLSPQLIDSCVDFFFDNLYPTQPILDRDRLQCTISIMYESVEAWCLVASLCAYMLIQPNMELAPGVHGEHESDLGSNLEWGKRLLAETIEVRKGCNYVEFPTLDSVTISFFFFGSNFCLEKHNLAWFHLREATTLALFLGMHHEDTYLQIDAVEAKLSRRLFWVLFVTERAYALQTQKPLTLHATIALPDLSIDPTDAVALKGFSHLIVLFRPFDDTFVGLWNQSSSGCTTGWVTMLHAQLSAALPQFLSTTESQMVDLRTSQQWLRVMLWQLSISNKLLSSTADHETMTFQYPIDLSRDLLAETSTFSRQAMDVHGIGLVKKLFDVACTLIDVMTCVPLEPGGFELGPRDYLNHFLHLMGNLRGGNTRYLPLLLSKVNEALPGLAEGGMPSALALPATFVRAVTEVADNEMPVVDEIQMDDSSTEGSYTTYQKYKGPTDLSPSKRDFSDLASTAAYSDILATYDSRRTESRSFSPPGHAQPV